jgi:hypothetical protein
MPRSNTAVLSPATLSHCGTVVFGPFCGLLGMLTKVLIAYLRLSSTGGETFALPARGAG